MYNTEVQVDELYSIKLGTDGILRVHVSDKREETVEDLKQLFFEIGKKTNGKKVPVLFTYDTFVYSSKEVNAYWTDPETTCPYFVAEAFIAETLGQKLMGNFYLKKHTSNREVRMFAKEENAIVWLKTFFTKNNL